MPARLSHAGLGLARAAVVACGVATATAQSLAPALRVTVMTTVGEEVKGLFLGATESEVTVESQGRKITLPLRDVSREGREKAAPYKRLVTVLKDARRYAESAACFDEAIRLDPHDEKFYSENRAIRETWTPSSCPVDATSGRTQ